MLSVAHSPVFTVRMFPYSMNSLLALNTAGANTSALTHASPEPASFRHFLKQTHANMPLSPPIAFRENN